MTRFQALRSFNLLQFVPRAVPGRRDSRLQRRKTARSAERSMVTAMALVDANAPSAVDTAIIQRPVEGATSPHPMPTKLYDHEKSRNHVSVSPKSNGSACSNSSPQSCTTTRSPEAMYNKGVTNPPVHHVLSMSVRVKCIQSESFSLRVYEYMSSDSPLVLLRLPPTSSSS